MCRMTAKYSAQEKVVDKKKKEIGEYIHAIDLSMVKDQATLENIYKEISLYSYYLATNIYTSDAIESLVEASNSRLLIEFLQKIAPRACYTKTGSRVVENIYKRLFDCYYLYKDYFMFEEVIGRVDIERFIGNVNAAHVLREIISLLTQKKVLKSSVEKFKQPLDYSSSQKNIEFVTSEIQRYKKLFIELILSGSINSKDAWVTLGVFLKCTKSQSLISAIINQTTINQIVEEGYLYEILPSIASNKNLKKLYAKIKANIMLISLTSSSSYFMKEFVLYYPNPLSIFNRFSFNEVEVNNNVVLALLESLITRRCHEKVKMLLENFYGIHKNLFYEFLLSKYDTLDTKYVSVIVALMKVGAKDNYGVNDDFIKHFSKRWTYSKGGKRLIAGYLLGSADREEKKAFCNTNIEAFWKCDSWKEGSEFSRLLIEYSSGHSRKKAYEMLERCKSSSLKL